MDKATANRMSVKNPENSLHHRIMEDVGLSKAQADVTVEIVLEWAQKNLNSCRPPNQIVRTVVAADEPAGKPIKHCRTMEVNLSVSHRYDTDILTKHGTVAYRRAKIFRLTWEAYEQGALMSYEDLAVVMGLDRATIKNLVQALRQQGLFVPTRGMMRDMGRAPSHKAVICRLLARGYVYTAIQAMTGHSEHSIERYALDFGRVIALCDTGVNPNDIRIICDRGEKTIQTYIDLYKEHNNDEFRPHLDKLKRRFESGKGIPGPGQYPTKKNSANSTERLKERNFENGLAQTLQKCLALTKPVADMVVNEIINLEQNVFMSPEKLAPGQTIIFVDSAASAPKYSGQTNKNRTLIPVVLSPWTQDKIDIWGSRRPTLEKRALIADGLAREAKRQGGTMTVNHLALLTGTSPTVLASCLARLRQRQHDPTPIKGITEDAGATLTHKEVICDLQDDGYTPPEISKISLHAPQSRDRYLKTNLRVETLARVLDQIPDDVQTARFLGIQRCVARQYLKRLQCRASNTTDAPLPTPCLSNTKPSKKTVVK